MQVHTRTSAYEAWLSKHAGLIRADLEVKHRKMARGPRQFLRATFYRWVELWPDGCPGLQDAPRVLAVGDLHVENFGSWRDREGRLVWGINDFDEAWPLPYTNDLVRLSASALLATGPAGWSLSPKDVCAAILAGYKEGIEKGGRPFVVDEKNRWFAPMMNNGLRDSVRFWQKMRSLPEVEVKKIPIEAREPLMAQFPHPSNPFRFAQRTAGLGSLGKPRFLALSNWNGGLVAREAKALTPSACAWHEGETSTGSLSENAMDGAVRCPDPFVHAKGAWIVRRLAPDCGKIELSSLSRVKDQERQLHAMGFETANVHVGTTDAVRDVRRDLSARPRKWLRNAAETMIQVTLKDQREWKRSKR